MDGADWLRTQLTSFGCAACGEPYEMGRIRVLAERDGLFFVDLACARCESQAVAIVTVQTDDDEPRADPFDLALVASSDDGMAVTPSGAAPVTVDDVLAVHELLDDFEGDMHALLRRLDEPGRGAP
jgi:hypothetical protein